MQVNWVEADRVLSVVYILTEGWKLIGFICRSSVTPGTDDISCVIEVVVVAVATS